ncbi:MAG: phosphoadenylyl-sulfate reductase [Anaerolineae bacterium]|nr:phosphoadenylyl-sulfate reductase [Anaerolineae bacterium]MDK1080157.1 phosphoadenylyl-sulfate reductase [Anaerolineae bacterium]MDK1117848.1 phosphoadenylyl-sulfate reductase [Anaerolineae bacterium]
MPNKDGLLKLRTKDVISGDSPVPTPHPTKPDMVPRAWSAENLVQINKRFENKHPRNLLRWGLDVFGDDLVLATSFGPQSIVLMHLLAQLRQDATIFYIDTDLLFPETYALRDELASRLGMQFTRVHSGLSVEQQGAEYGPKLWTRNPDQCCFMRKVKPLNSYLATKQAWITGIRRQQSSTRVNARMVEWDYRNKLVKLNPLVLWKREEVWDYLRHHDLPYNPLHDKNYLSIGCSPCTSPVLNGADERSGRWAGLEKNECGININVDPTSVHIKDLQI